MQNIIIPLPLSIPAKAITKNPNLATKLKAKTIQIQIPTGSSWGHTRWVPLETPSPSHYFTLTKFPIALIAIAGVVLGWIAIEIACKPCLEQGREAIDRSLNPDYDPDDAVSNNNIRAPLITSESDDPVVVVASSSTSYDSSVKPI